MLIFADFIPKIQKNDEIFAPQVFSKESKSQKLMI